MTAENILWLIPARSGSKGIRDKNIRMLGLHPLMSYRIMQALAMSRAENVWVSTDSEEYADIARQYGARVPYMRPPELASDQAKSEDVVLHAMRVSESMGLKYDAIGLLEPTSPFVYKSQILSAISEMSLDAEATGIVATKVTKPSRFYIQPKEEYLSEIAERISCSGILRRQEEPIEITPAGGFYISKWRSFFEHESFYTPKTRSAILPDINAVEIDHEIEFKWAEFLLGEGQIDLNRVFKGEQYE